MELTILEVQSSWHSGSSSYAKAGKQAVTVELTLLQIQTSQYCSSQIYVTPTELIYCIQKIHIILFSQNSCSKKNYFYLIIANVCCYKSDINIRHMEVQSLLIQAQRYDCNGSDLSDASYPLLQVLFLCHHKISPSLYH